MIKKAKALLEKIKNNSIAITLYVKELLFLWHAMGWQRIYSLQNWFSDVKSNYGAKLGVLFLIVCMVTSIVFIPTLQNFFEQSLSESVQLDSVQALFLTLGGALIGATAIAFSFIMFAMQVNVERMPHGLFRKFSSDAKLLGTFAVTFFLAAIILGLSLTPDKSWVVGATIVTVWCSILIVLLFVLAYRRALTLISPTMQLGLVVADTKKNFKILNKAVKRTTPMIRFYTKTEKDNEEIQSKYDMDRVTYFQLNPYWTTPAEQAISYCITFSKRYAEQGDYEVSQVALNGIVSVNELYVRTKGKTFFSENYLIDNPLASDSFLMNTLEHLRQNVQVGVSRQDEQFIEQNFKCLYQLTQLYLSVEYGDEHATKSHAHLVSGYLTSAVESAIPHDMADVLIEGVTLLGKVARLIVSHDKSEHIASISEKIALIAGTVYNNYQPVTQVAVRQLASLTFELLRSKSRDVRFAMKEVRDDVKLIAEVYLMRPDSPLNSIHSSSLAPYYSGTSNDTLMSWLTKLVNAISGAEPNDETAQRVIGHISEWSDGLYRIEKELLLTAIEKRSRFTFDLSHWIVHITKLLLAVSCVDACDENNRDELRKWAVWLIYVFDWIPGDEDTIKYVEGYQIADKIFEAAFDAQKRGCEEVALEIRNLLLNWTFKVGKYQTGWASLKKAICGMVCLNLILELSDEKLFTEIDTYLSTENAPSLEIRSKTASDLHEEADKYRSGFAYDEIEMAMTRVDQARLRVLLHGVAEHLCPKIHNAESSEIMDVT